MKQRVKAIIAGKQVEVEWSLNGGRLEARIDERVYDVEVRFRKGVSWLASQGKSIEAFVEESGEGLQVTVGDHVIPIELLDSRKALSRIGQSGHEGTVTVRAPMPGRIVKVLAAQGTEIAANQGIVVMEAMKMQNEIKSPKSGRVLKLNVAQGGAVAAGDVIAEVGDPG